MSTEEKAAATRDFAYQQRLRAADALDADATKARRDADEQRRLSKRNDEHAHADWLAFCDRAAAEGMGVPYEIIAADHLIVLPRTKGNDRVSMESLLTSRKLTERAGELDALAQRKAQEAAGARAAAETMPPGPGAAALAAAPMPHGPGATALAAAAMILPASAISPQVGSEPAAVGGADLRASMLALEQAEIDEDDRHNATRAESMKRRRDRLMTWTRTADLRDAPLPPLGADPRESEARDYHARMEMNEVLSGLRAVRQANPNGVDDNRAIELAKNHWSLYLSTRSVASPGGLIVGGR